MPLSHSRFAHRSPRTLYVPFYFFFYDSAQLQEWHSRPFLFVIDRNTRYKYNLFACSKRIEKATLVLSTTPIGPASAKEKLWLDIIQADFAITLESQRGRSVSRHSQKMQHLTRLLGFLVAHWAMTATILVFLATALALSLEVNSRTFYVKNSCSYTVWCVVRCCICYTS